MKKGENGRYPLEYRLWAVDQLRKGIPVDELSQQTGIHRTQLFRWRKNPIHPDSKRNRAEEPAAEVELYEELQRVKKVLAEKVLELDFVKGALQRIEARRQKSTSSGETTSTERSKP